MCVKGTTGSQKSSFTPRPGFPTAWKFMENPKEGQIDRNFVRSEKNEIKIPKSTQRILAKKHSKVRWYTSPVAPLIRNYINTFQHLRARKQAIEMTTRSVV